MLTGSSIYLIDLFIFVFFPTCEFHTFIFHYDFPVLTIVEYSPERTAWTWVQAMSLPAVQGIHWTFGDPSVVPCLFQDVLFYKSHALA